MPRRTVGRQHPSPKTEHAHAGRWRCAHLELIGSRRVARKVARSLVDGLLGSELPAMPDAVLHQCVRLL